MDSDGENSGNSDGTRIKGGNGGNQESDSTTLGFLVFQFLSITVNELQLTREQVSLFCVGVERVVDHLCHTKADFTLELAEQAIEEEVALLKKIRQLKLCRRGGNAPAESNYDVLLLPLRPELVN